MMTREELKNILKACLTKEVRPHGKSFDDILGFYNYQIGYSDLYIDEQYSVIMINAHVRMETEKNNKKETAPRVSPKELKSLINPDAHHDNYNADDEALFEEKYQKRFGEITC